MKRTRMKVKDLHEMLNFEVTWSKKDKVEYGKNGWEVLIINGQVSFFKRDVWLPTLRYLGSHLILPKVVVDTGAIRFVVNGADIMRPGITEMESFDAGAYIVIVDEVHGKPLSLGQALLSSIEMKQASKGKVIKNIHYVGDDLWKVQT